MIQEPMVFLDCLFQMLRYGSTRQRITKGPLLITHRGMSGPAILKLSAWEARKLQEKNYHFDFSINWLADISETSIREAFENQRIENGKKTLKNTVLFDLSRRLWESFFTYANISPETTWSQLSKKVQKHLLKNSHKEFTKHKERQPIKMNLLLVEVLNAEKLTSKKWRVNWSLIYTLLESAST